jgi:hypothetical protein
LTNAGDLVSATILGKSIIIINSYSIADALLNRKGAIYSDRPQYTMASELVGWNKPMTLLNQGERHRFSRAVLHKTIGTVSSLSEYYPLIEAELRSCMGRILQDPADISKELRQYEIFLFAEINSHLPLVQALQGLSSSKSPMGMMWRRKTTRSSVKQTWYCANSTTSLLLGHS